MSTALFVQRTLDIECFSQMMKDPSYCYKFYWLEAIVNLISQGIRETTFDEIIDEMIAKMSNQQAYQLLEKANAHAATLAEPDWSKQEGHWSKAASAGIVDGTAPERPVKRDELAAILGRKGLL